MSDDSQKLRMAPAEPSESPERLATRLKKENRAVLFERELNLERSLGQFRAGSVPHLNAVPLTRGLEDQILFLPPSQLAVELRAGRLDAALLSVTEALYDPSYDVLDGVGISSLGEVKSVFLAHRQPLEQIREIYCDTASLASFNLLKVFLAERKIHAELKPLPAYEQAKTLDNVFLIGDHALDFLLSEHEHDILDLGAAWYELTGLPFVFAVWTLRSDRDTAPLRRILREAKRFGMDTLDAIIDSRAEYTPEFRKDYLSWNIHFHLGSDERRGIAKFVELLRQHNIGPARIPRFVM
jgi:predicted solute-binding protein